MTFFKFLSRRGIFRLAAVACILGIVLTTLAMWFYPGGTAMDPGTRGYSFGQNFLSEGGMARTPSGAVNLASLVLLIAALSLVGMGLAIFILVRCGSSFRARVQEDG